MFMEELSVAPVAITVAHLRLALDLSVPRSYEVADLLGAFTLPGAKRGKRVLLSSIREHLGDAVADQITATMSGTLPASAGPVLMATNVEDGPGAGRGEAQPREPGKRSG